MNWIKDPIILEGEKIILEPLQEKHFDDLIHAGRDENIWKYLPVKGSDPELLKAELQESLVQQEKGLQYPFVVINRTTQEIIGSTRFLKISEEYRNLEIGWTWYIPTCWGKGFNDECKLLVLTHCFEVMKTVRVQIVANEKNIPSRRAIERIGGKFEGILRSAVIRNGEKRNMAYYSIIEEEWPEVKSKLVVICDKQS